METTEQQTRNIAANYLSPLLSNVLEQLQFRFVQERLKYCLRQSHSAAPFQDWKHALKQLAEQVQTNQVDSSEQGKEMAIQSAINEPLFIRLYEGKESEKNMQTCARMLLYVQWDDDDFTRLDTNTCQQTSDEPEQCAPCLPTGLEACLPVKTCTLYLADETSSEQEEQRSWVILPVCERRERRGILVFPYPEADADCIHDLARQSKSVNSTHTNGGRLIYLPDNWYHNSSPDHPLGLLAGMHALPDWDALYEKLYLLKQLADNLNKEITPIISEAAWKRRAHQIMHEINSTLSFAEPGLQSGLQVSSQQIASLRRLNTWNDEERDTQLRMATDNHRAFKEIENKLRHAKSKVNWYFRYLGRPAQNDSLPKEQHVLHELLQQALERLGYLMDVREDLTNPDDPLWQCKMETEAGFAVHSFESLLSNAVRHREPGSRIQLAVTRLSQASDDEPKVRLTWRNQPTQEESHTLRRIFEQTPHPVAGLAIAGTIAEKTLNAQLTYQLLPAAEHPDTPVDVVESQLEIDLIS